MNKRAFEQLLQTRQNGIVRDGQVQAQAVALAILGEIADAIMYSVLRAADFHVFAVYPDYAGIHWICAADQTHRFSASRADQTGKAENFTLAEFE